MKKLRSYLLSAVVMLLFTCTFMGVKAEAATAPAQVTGLKQTDASTGSIELEWTALLDNDVDYQVDVSTDKTNWVTKKEATYGNDAYISSLNAGTSYYARVRAYTKERDANWNYVYNYGQWSSIIECVTEPNSKPSYLQKTASTTTTMTLKWGEVPGANAYIVEYQPTSSNTNAKKSVTVASNTTKLTKLKKNTNYQVYVYPVRVNSSKTFTAESSSYIYEYHLGVTPGKVTGVECDYYWQSMKEISVQYNTISSAEGYQVEVWTANKKKDTKIASAWGTAFGADIKKSVFGKHNMIKIRVRAYTENYNEKKVYGSWSSWKYVCPQPDVTKIKCAQKGMTVTWDKISGADRYIVYASTKQKSGYKKVATTTKTSYTMKKFNKKALKKGKTYYFYVVAQKKVGKKYYSGEAGNADTCWYKKYTY